MAGHTRDGEAALIGRTQAGQGVRRAFTMLELAIAMAIFLLLASVVTLAVGSSTAASHRQHLQSAASAALDQAVGELANASYDSLVSDDFVPPSPCTSGPIGAAATSCLYPLGKAAGSLVVHWSAVVASAGGGSSSVELTGYATLADGQHLSASQTVDAPSSGYVSGEGSVRVSLAGLGGLRPSSLAVPLLLLDQNGNKVAAASVNPGNGGLGVALFHVPAGDCAPGAPCHLGLRSGTDGSWLPSTASTSGVALSAASVIGPGAAITVEPGTLVEASGALYQTASAELALEATNSGGQAGVPPAASAGSVCLWLSFNDGVAQRSEPFCNSTAATSITTATYVPNPAEPDFTLALPVGVPLSLSVDNPDGSCPQVGGMVGDTTGGWVPAAVCTSWTWGVPATLTSGGTTRAFSGSSLTLSPGTTSDTTVTWSDTSASGGVWAAASPASGYAGEPTWGKPREAAGCAFDGSCLSLGTTVPESSLCPAQHCLSVAHFAPELTSPASGPAGVATVAVSGSSTPFALGVSDPDTDNPPVSLKVTVTSVPTQGSVSFNGQVVSAGQVLVSNAASPWSGQLTYNAPTQLNGTDTMTLSLDGGQGVVVSKTIGFYSQVAPWALSASPVTAAQNSSAVSLPVTVTGTDGKALSGVQVSASSPNAGLSFTGATSNPSGVADLSVAVAAASAGVHQFTLTAGSGSTGVTLADTITVTPVLSAITVSTPALAEGGSAKVTLSASDAGGGVFSGAAVQVAVGGGSGVSLEEPSCVTSDKGTCSVTLDAAANAATGSYTLTGSAGSAQASTTFAVSPTVEKVTASTTTIDQGAAGTLSVTVEDGTGAPVQSSTVSFSNASVSFSPASATTTSSGVASTQVQVPAGTMAGTLEVAVVDGGYHGTVALDVVPVATSLVANGPSLSVVQGASATSWVTIYDGAGNPMPGVTVTLSPSSGLQSAASTISSSPLGQADITVRASASSAPGTSYAVKASVPGLASVSVPVTVVAAP